MHIEYWGCLHRRWVGEGFGGVGEGVEVLV